MNRVSLPFNLAPSSIHIRVATISSHSPGRRHRWQSGRKMYLRTFESSSSTSLSSLCGCYRYQLYKRGALTPSCQTLPSWIIIIILLLLVLFCWEFFFLFFFSLPPRVSIFQGDNEANIRHIISEQRKWPLSTGDIKVALIGHPSPFRMGTLFKWADTYLFHTIHHVLDQNYVSFVCLLLLPEQKRHVQFKQNDGICKLDRPCLRSPSTSHGDWLQKVDGR